MIITAAARNHSYGTDPTAHALRSTFTSAAHGRAHRTDDAAPVSARRLAAPSISSLAPETPAPSGRPAWRLMALASAVSIATVALPFVFR